MARRRRRRGGWILPAGLAFGMLALVAFRACVPGGDPPPIPWGWGSSLVPRFVGAPAVPRPIVVPPVPQHPFMAANGANNMHNDSYITDTHAVSGPLGVDPEVRSAARGLLGGECASVTFDRQHSIVTVCMLSLGNGLLYL